MKGIEKQYASHSSCTRHLKAQESKGIVYYDASINKLDEGCYVVMYKVFDMPDELIRDMAITINLFANMFNTNDETLEAHGIDWWYLHKLNRRVQKRCSSVIDFI